MLNLVIMRSCSSRKETSVASRKRYFLLDWSSIILKRMWSVSVQFKLRNIFSCQLLLAEILMILLSLLLLLGNKVGCCVYTKTRSGSSSDIFAGRKFPHNLHSSWLGCNASRCKLRAYALFHSFQRQCFCGGVCNHLFYAIVGSRNALSFWVCFLLELTRFFQDRSFGSKDVVQSVCRLSLHLRWWTLVWKIFCKVYLLVASFILKSLGFSEYVCQILGT